MLQDLVEIRKYWHTAEDLGSLPNDYQSWSAKQKQDFLWNEKILKSKYDELPPLEKIDIPGLFLTALKTKMDREYDEAPPKWKKAIHAHGSVAKIKIVSTGDSPFTGLFKGVNHGFLRVSVTADPADRGVAPGLAIKLLVDGKSSGNFSALVSLTGQGKNYNLLSNEFSNIVPVVNEFGPILINLIFSRVTRYPTKLYLEDMSEVDQHGQTVSNPHYPSQLFLVPNRELKFSEAPHDFRKDFTTISSDTQLFSIYAVDPKKIDGKLMGKPEYRQKAQLIGHITTTSEFVSSFYGDSQLFFRHQRFKNR
ncbi:MAG: hypothetical protein ACKO2Z_30075 [Sphaerospermopsis kisseleviana]